MAFRIQEKESPYGFYYFYSLNDVYGCTSYYANHNSSRFGKLRPSVVPHAVNNTISLPTLVRSDPGPLLPELCRPTSHPRLQSPLGKPRKLLQSSAMDRKDIGHR
jgi:hypothetical protein